ncbi:NUDIX hydrolase [Puniceicoccaceae bacterium K14]|nr:NUDIX hydrolase [Puniceicoccaceae bacterium K14]
MSETDNNYRLGVLLYAFGPNDRLLLIKRAKKPHKGLWCAVGGKLEMSNGESPYECAVREAKEEIDVDLVGDDLDLKCVISEKNYEGVGHWLMFIFVVKREIQVLPDSIDEGVFGFFELGDLDEVAMPAFDRKILLERILRTDGPALSFLRVNGKGESLTDSLFVEQESIRKS